ncbi:hypothetical protein E4U42_000050 [Claviceps africana]|uniref:Uncharacterized protein n=1 Tax=Claviceps africana TaxID=83212 RepID=A0A8K0NJU6_9HYPO|nr:hypothetical protein E4U42_000050 [Claviceps africana]
MLIHVFTAFLLAATAAATPVRGDVGLSPRSDGPTRLLCESDCVGAGISRWAFDKCVEDCVRAGGPKN